MPDQVLDLSAHAEEPGEIDAGRYAEIVEESHHVLGRHIAARPMGERRSAEPTDRRVEAADTGD